jgi:hypothetical protein
VQRFLMLGAVYVCRQVHSDVDSAYSQQALSNRVTISFSKPCVCHEAR